MPKEWILNSATTRFQFNFKRNVGAVSEEIRRCSPKTMREWREYYFSNVRTESHIKALGEKLYIKITEVIPSEVEEITEQDCIDYISNLVINRTFDGYRTEIKTIYGQLAEQLGHEITAAPDNWDRGYNVDFFIEVNGKFIGIQIKPVSNVSHITQIYQERSWQKQTHADFKKKYGGKVFYVFSIKEGNRKRIVNADVVEELQKEIKRLESG